MTTASDCLRCGHVRAMHKAGTYAALGPCLIPKELVVCSCRRYVPPWVVGKTKCVGCPHSYYEHKTTSGGCVFCECHVFGAPNIDPDNKKKCAFCPHAKFVHRGTRCVAVIGGNRKPCGCAGFAYRRSEAPHGGAFERPDDEFFQGIRGELK